MISELTKFNRVFAENKIVCCHKFLEECPGYLVKVADHPTAIFILPVIYEPNEVANAVDVRCKRERPAGNRTVISLAFLMPQALDQYLPFWCIRLKSFSFVRVIWIPEMPKICIGSEIFPFVTVGSRDGVFNITAEWYAIFIIGCTFPATV